MITKNSSWCALRRASTCGSFRAQHRRLLRLLRINNLPERFCSALFTCLYVESCRRLSGHSVLCWSGDCVSYHSGHCSPLCTRCCVQRRGSWPPSSLAANSRVSTSSNSFLCLSIVHTSKVIHYTAKRFRSSCLSGYFVWVLTLNLTFVWALEVLFALGEEAFWIFCSYLRHIKPPSR